MDASLKRKKEVCYSDWGEVELCSCDGIRFLPVKGSLKEEACSGFRRKAEEVGPLSAINVAALTRLPLA